jgi:hypothetical protein
MKPYLPVILLLGCAGGLVLGIVQLFELRFEAGDVYPEYSSLRSDPLGTMGFYESINGLPGLTARRDFTASNDLPGEKDATYFHIATSIDAFLRLPGASLEAIERFVTSGGRMVITISAEAAARSRPREQERSKIDRWGIGFQVLALSRNANGVYAPQRVRNESGLSLPAELDWHSGIVFSGLSPAWKRIYARGMNAVVVERDFGRGGIVIVTDSYFLSNEAMVRDRHADLLSWLIGPNRIVIFDEAHLGVVERPGVAALTRKYRLQWLLAGLIVLAGLFIWKNSVSLVPPRTVEERKEYIAGKDAAAGFDGLLRRGIVPRDLLALCFGEWKKSAAQTGKYSKGRIQQAEAAFETERALAAKDRDPVRAYRTIAKILQTKIK